jgi:ribosome-associated protein
LRTQDSDTLEAATAEESGAAVDTRQRVLAIAGLMDAQKATDIRILRVSKTCNFADVFVIASCGSGLQLRALANKIERQQRDQGFRLLGMAGYDTTTWILLDYGDVVVHLFNPDTRDYYRLERLWADAEAIQWSAAC